MTLQSHDHHMRLQRSDLVGRVLFLSIKHGGKPYSYCSASDELLSTDIVRIVSPVWTSE